MSAIAVHERRRVPTGHVLAVQSWQPVSAFVEHATAMYWSPPQVVQAWQTASAFEVHDGLSHCVSALHVVQSLHSASASSKHADFCHCDS